MVKRIVVGSDGSGTARQAVEQAVELAKAVGGELTIVRAYTEDLPDALTAYDPRLRESEETAQLPDDVPRPVGRRAEVMAGLEAEVAAAVDAGLANVRSEARQGEPAEAIIAFAEESGADLIVVGNKGMTGAARFLLGSVPNKITHHAPCNVLVVRTT